MSENDQAQGHSVELSVIKVGQDRVLSLSLPLTRIKKIMKADADIKIVSQHAAQLISSATERFIQFLGQEAFKNANKDK
jgi:histone H3/H4